jgi:hypothetical protein
MTGRRDRDSELPDGGLQPRSVVDARRHPPRSEACRQVREMLRDHADGDLPAGLQRRVEDHVYQCRDCGLALSRAELEVLRLKQALAESAVDDPAGPRVGPSEDFTAAVMARARAELRREQDDWTTAGFTRKVMRRVQRQVQREAPEPAADRRGWWSRRRVLVGAAAAVLLISGVLVVNAPGGRATHVDVIAAEDAWLLGADGRDDAELLGADSVLPQGARLRTGAAGRLHLSLPALAGRGSGSQLRLDADGELRLDRRRNGVLHLGHGRLRVATGGELDVHLTDATKVVLGEGEYQLEALLYHPFDHDLFQAPSLRVRLVVAKGRAQIWRGGEGTEVIEGQVAYFTNRTPVRQDRAVSEELLAASLENAAVIARQALAAQGPAAVDDTPWLGRLVHPVSRQPVVAAAVSVRSHLGEHTLTSDAEGRFQAPDLPQLVGQFVVVTARATDAVGGSLEQGPSVLALGRLVAGEAPVELAMARHRRLAGRILDPDNRPVAAVRLLPVLVDEVLGLVQPLVGLITGVAPDGHFVVDGLPARLPPRMSLTLVALCGDGAPQVCFSSQGVEDYRDSALRLCIRPRPVARLAGLPAGADLEILQPVDGVAPLRLFGRRDVASNLLGEAELRHGFADTLWLLRLDQPPQMLRAGADGVLRPVTTGDQDAAAALALLRPRSERQPGTQPELHASGAGQSHRLQRVAEVPVQGAGRQGFITVHLPVDLEGSPVLARTGASLFLREDGSSEVLFLGVCAGGALPFQVPRGRFTLVAIDPEGRFGQLQVLAAAEPGPQPRLSVPLWAPRSLLLSDVLVARARAAGGVVQLRLDGADGAAGRGEVLYLTRQLRAMDSGEIRGLLPGSYQISFGDGTSVSRRVR